MESKINKFNEQVAVKGVQIFGSMWICYLFLIYGFAPIIFPLYMDKMLYASNAVQLWSLPLIMVGTNVLGKAMDKLIRSMHHMIKEELKEIKEILLIIHKVNLKQDEEVQAIKLIVGGHCKHYLKGECQLIKDKTKGGN